MAAGGAACFALYVGLWTAQTLLVRGAVRPNGSYAFDTATVCFFIELLKLAGALLAIALGCDGAASEPRACARVRRALANAPASVPFALPSLLYAGYNLLQFVNLSLVPAPAFRTAINVKVLFTALLARCALPAAQLRGAQWLALLLLALGCAVAQLDERLHPISPGAFGLICLQGGLSSLAGVYTQWLLQLGAPPASGGGGGSGSGSGGGSGMRRECGQTASFGFWERGAFLYAWGAATNGLFLALFRPQAASSAGGWFAGYDGRVACIVLNGALSGFSTALLLRRLSAVAKEFANAAEILTTALVARALCETPLPSTLSAGATLVVGATLMFGAASGAGAAESIAAVKARRALHSAERVAPGIELQPLILRAGAV